MKGQTPTNSPQEFTPLYDAWPAFAAWWGGQPRGQKAGPADTNFRARLSKAITLFNQESRYPVPAKMVEFMTQTGYSTVAVKVKTLVK